MASPERGPGRERRGDGGQGQQPLSSAPVKQLVEVFWTCNSPVSVCVPLQPIPVRREERPVSCFMPGSGPMPLNLAAVARDAANLARDKQRSQVASMMISNETYGTVLDLNLLPPGPTPPLPPRAPNRGQSWIRL